MRHLPNRLKPAAWVSLGLFVLLLIGSFVYYKERMLFADASHIAFMAINEGKLQIQQYRFGAAITQIVPVVGAKIGLSVNNIMLLYSASFHLFYLAVACTMMFAFRAYRLLILYALYWTLVTTHTFFWPNNEIHQGVAYMFLMFPLLLACGKRNLPFIIPVLTLTLLGGTALFCHPLVLPSFIFLWVYHICEKTHWPFNKGRTIILSAILLMLIALKLFVSAKYAGYDQELLVNAHLFSWSSITGAFNSPFATEVYRHIPLNYWQMPILCVLGIVWLIVKKKYFLAIWTFGCVLTLFFLMCSTFKGYMEFISESELMSCIIIACTPFVFEILPSIGRPWLTALLLLAIFTVRFQAFYAPRLHFSDRVDKLGQMLVKMKKMGTNKLILITDGPPEWTWMVNWGFAEESLIMSGSIWDQPARQIVVLSEKEAQWRLPVQNNEVILCFVTKKASELNYKYFPFDTTKPYTVMKYEEFMNAP